MKSVGKREIFRIQIFRTYLSFPPFPPTHIFNLCSHVDIYIIGTRHASDALTIKEGG